MPDMSSSGQWFGGFISFNCYIIYIYVQRLDRIHAWNILNESASFMNGNSFSVTVFAKKKMAQKHLKLKNMFFFFARHPENPAGWMLTGKGWHQTWFATDNVHNIKTWSCNRPPLPYGNVHDIASSFLHLPVYILPSACKKVQWSRDSQSLLTLLWLWVEIRGEEMMMQLKMMQFNCRSKIFLFFYIPLAKNKKSIREVYDIEWKTCRELWWIFNCKNNQLLSCLFNYI